MGIGNVVTFRRNGNKNREDIPASPGKRHGVEKNTITSRRNGIKTERISRPPRGKGMELRRV
jgi:hypothetical protein